jgi:hypothetical protein
MSRMSDLHIKLMEEHYHSLSEEEKNYFKTANTDQIYWDKNCDNSP